MMSFAAFKYHALDAFSGEPVTIELSRREQHWWLTPAAVRSFCLDVYKSLAEAHEEQAAEDENLRTPDGHKCAN